MDGVDVGSIIGGLAVPALAVYGPELFPTALRTKANVIITVLGVSGSVIGLLAVGRLAERWSLGRASPRCRWDRPSWWPS